jgi:hypothetical protein
MKGSTLAAERSAAQRVPLQRLTWLVPLAVTVAIIANTVFYYVVTGLLGEPLRFPSPSPEAPERLAPMPVYDVILVSALFATGAGVVYALTTRLSRRPTRTYLVIATLVLLISCLLPMKIPSPPVALSAKLSLVAMHIIGAVAVVGTMLGLGSHERRSGQRH